MTPDGFKPLHRPLDDVQWQRLWDTFEKRLRARMQRRHQQRFPTPLAEATNSLTIALITNKVLAAVIKRGLGQKPTVQGVSTEIVQLWNALCGEFGAEEFMVEAEVE